mmetsp:Transcript_8442/g.10679  ORF Transcript_8442/g.10679 Transcript_8442/m.10679 type:complete len:287 (+) Transcript_8442:103-963(+)
MLEEKRNTAVAILNIILQHLASRNEVGALVTIYPQTGNPHNQLYNNVYKHQLYGLLLTLGCIRVYRGAISKAPLEIWNNVIGICFSQRKDYQFTTIGKDWTNQTICLHIKQSPRVNNKNEKLTLDQHESLQTYKLEYLNLEKKLNREKKLKAKKAAVAAAAPVPSTPSKGACPKRKLPMNKKVKLTAEELKQKERDKNYKKVSKYMLKKMENKLKTQEEAVNKLKTQEEVVNNLQERVNFLEMQLYQKNATERSNTFVMQSQMHNIRFLLSQIDEKDERIRELSRT